MSAVTTNAPTNYYYGNFKLSEPPANYRQQRYDAEVKRQKAIENGVKFKRTTYNPNPKPPKDPFIDGRKHPVYDLVNDRIFPSISEAAKALGVPYETIRYRAQRGTSVIFI